MKICVVSLYTPNISNIGDCMYDNVSRYCTKQQYDFVCGKESLDESRHPVWSKILILQSAIATNKYDWILWIDADALVVNDDIRIEDIIDRHRTSESLVLVSQDRNGLNAGVFLIKACQESHKLLQEVYDNVECLDHPLREQESLRRLLEESNRYGDAYKYIPKNEINSYLHPYHTGGYQPGDFIIHFAGYKAKVPYLMQKYYTNTATKLNQRARNITAIQVLLLVLIVALLVLLFRQNRWSDRSAIVILLIISIVFIVSLYFLC